MSSPILLDHALARVKAHRSRRIPGQRWMTRAAVAVVLAPDADRRAHALLVRRAARKGDPWSGHMAFPGGRSEPADRSSIATAERETCEELGIELGREARHIGKLSDLLTREHGRPRPMTVIAHVFESSAGPWEDFVYSGEIAEALWIPLDVFDDPTRQTTRRWRILGRTRSMPAYEWEGRVIWGLTLQLLRELVAVSRGRRRPTRWRLSRAPK